MNQEDENIKKRFIELIDKVDYKGSISEMTKDFITTYDGTNTKEFAGLIMHVVATLMQLKKLEVKETAYDKMEEQIDDFNISLNKIESDFDAISTGQKIKRPNQTLK